MPVDPHLLRTFVTVAECGSFSAAAARLGYTQSAVSQHIAALENDLGTPLLRRRPVVPTASGERLLEHAGPILLRLDAARADVRRAVADPPSSLTVAATPLAARSLANRLAEVRRSHPGAALALTVCGRAEVVEGVAAGTFVLGLTDGVTAPTDPLHLSDAVHLHTTPTSEEELVVALPESHPLARSAAGPLGSDARSAARRGLSLGDLVDARWIDAPDLAAPLAALRTAAGSDALHPALTYNGTDLHTLLTLIESGHGLAVLPHSAVTQNLAAVPLINPRLVHRTEILYADLTSPAAESLAAKFSHQ